MYSQRAGPSTLPGLPSAAQKSPQKSSAKQRRASIPTAISTVQRKSKTAKSIEGDATDRERTYVETASRPATPKSVFPSSGRPPKQRATAENKAKGSAVRKFNKSQNAINTTPRASTSRTEPSPVIQLQPQLIRRVKAVIEVPVKEEEYSDDEGLETTRSSSPSGSEYTPEKPKRANGCTTTSRKSIATKGKARDRQIDDDGRGKQSNRKQDDSTAVRRRASYYQAHEEDDDQLLIGSGVSPEPRSLYHY